MAYARHQSFYFRDRWFSKGMNAVKNDNRFFYKKESFEIIGLGKNMLESLRFWLIAFKVIEEFEYDGVKAHKLTELGEVIYKYDKLLQQNDTLSILHYNLVRNWDDECTVFNWFYNTYRETVTSKQELLKSFITWVENNEPREISENSLRRDIDCLVQFYTKKADEGDPEDNIFCPFSRLGLIYLKPSGVGHELVIKNLPELNQIGLNSLYFVLLDYCALNEVELLSVDEIIEADYLLGKVFNLSRNKIVEALNTLTNHSYSPIQYIRTNNIDYIRVPNISPLDFLTSQYKKQFIERE